MTEVALGSATVLERAHASVTLTSLTIDDPNISYETLVDLLRFAGDLHQASAWWIGDTLNQTERRYGDKVYQAAADALGLSPRTCMIYASVCSRVPQSRRRAELKFSHHQEVAYKEPQEQQEWLEKAVRNEWSSSSLRAAIREAGVRGRSVPLAVVEHDPSDRSDVERLLDGLRSLFDEPTVSLWLATAIEQGWSMDRCLAHTEALTTGAYV